MALSILLFIMVCSNPPLRGGNSATRAQPNANRQRVDGFRSCASSASIAAPHSRRAEGIRRTAMVNNNSGASLRLITVRPSGDKMHDDQEITDDAKRREHPQRRKPPQPLAPQKSGKPQRQARDETEESQHHNNLYDYDDDLGITPAGRLRERAAAYGFHDH